MSKVDIDIYTDINKKNVADLILHIQTNEFGIPISLEKQPDLNDIPGFYQTNNGNFWIAKMDNKIVGTISLLDIGNRQGALRKMFVDKNYRGKDLNVGKTLLNTLMDWAKHKGFTEIFLGTTEKFLAAQRFYEKNGFNEITKQKLPATFPVMEVDVKFYRITV
jgi:GNAT superfamily N-acetyltransferase